MVSLAMLLLIFFFPADYTIISRSQKAIEAGRLFPVMWLIWLLALFSFALNNVFADRWYINDGLQMPQFKKYLPSLLGVPALISFGWFLYSWLKATEYFRKVVQIFYPVTIPDL